MKTAVIYSCHIMAREHEATIEEQIKQCCDYATANNLQIVGTYSDCVPEKSFTLNAREQLLADSKKKLWDAVILPSISILGRDKDASIKYIKMLKANVETKFIDMDDAMLDFMLQ